MLLNITQALTNGGVISDYLKQQLESHTGNTPHVLTVIQAIEDDTKHAYMKKANRLKMFDNIDIFHHHVNWSVLENAKYAIRHDPHLSKMFLNMLETKDFSQIEELTSKAIGMGVTHKTGQWLIYTKFNNLNYFIGIFPHTNDYFTNLEQELEKKYVGLKSI